MLIGMAESGLQIFSVAVGIGAMQGPGTMYPQWDPKMSIYNLGSGPPAPTINVEPLHWLPALPGQLLGDNVKYYQIGKKRSYGRLAMALTAVLLLAGLTANRYVASDNLRASVVVTRVTGAKAISELPADELLTATCPCKESLIRWSSIVSFTPSILAMSHNASKLSDGPDTFKVAQCNAMTLTGRPDVINASAINDTATNDMVNNDTCYKWPAISCSSILYDLRFTLPLVEEDDEVADQSPYLILPIMKGEEELKNLWQDYLSNQADNTYLTAYNSVIAHNQGMGDWLLHEARANATLQPDVPAFESFLDDMTIWLQSNNGDPCGSDPDGLDARGNKRVRAEIRETTKAFLKANTVVNTKKVRAACAPVYCDVMRRKTVLNWVTEVLSTIGGLWTVIIGSVAIAWAVINCFSCMGAGYGSYKVWHP